MIQAPGDEDVPDPLDLFCQQIRAILEQEAVSLERNGFKHEASAIRRVAKRIEAVLAI